MESKLESYKNVLVTVWLADGIKFDGWIMDYDNEFIELQSIKTYNNQLVSRRDITNIELKEKKNEASKQETTVDST